MEKLPDTIEECHKIIRLLLESMDNLTKRFEKLEIENRDLKERLNINSLNSSLSPSRDAKKKKQNHRKPSGKQSGGQPGHKGHYRELKSSEEVDVVQECKLPKSCLCGGEIRVSSEFVAHQVYELPVLKLKITEYRLQKGDCECCKRKQIASLPEGVS